MSTLNIPLLVTAGIAIALVAAALLVMILLRRVVPTNMVHIVQSTKATTVYGKGKGAGNTYYAIPAWVPKFGVSVLQMPESIFRGSLVDYEAYDSARLPFVVDVTAFFRVDNAETAAQRVSSFSELQNQLDFVLKGAVRRILATNTLEQIMEARSELGNQFTAEVDNQIAEWGVKTVKTIEFMDLRDSRSSGSEVIRNIMAKEQSRIDKESRVAVADNTRQAELAEIEARQGIELRKQEAEQQVGLRTAEREQAVGVAREQAAQQVQEQAAQTAEKLMAVQRVEQEQAALIKKQVAITEAAGRSEATRLLSEGELAKTRNDAQGVAARGEAEARAQELLLLAPVTAQTTLAKEIGSNDGYQTYLIRLEQVKAGQVVGVVMAEALKEADLKIIANGGSSDGGAVQNSVSGLLDMFTAKGGTNITSMLAALAQTDEGQAVLSKLTGAAKSV